MTDEINYDTPPDRRWRFLIALCVLLASTAVLASIVQHRRLQFDSAIAPSKKAHIVDDEPFAARMPVLALEIIAYGWVFSLAATVASFLNVVVYRLPRGMEIVKTPSHCPKCDGRIRLTDNVPVFGWLKLRGRCRDCGQPISSRYPLVEGFFGLLIVVLAAVELFSGGANLPVRPINSYTGAAFILWSGKWDLIGIFLYHSVMLGYLMTIALIHWDDDRMPMSLPIGCIGVGLFLPLFWPDLHLVPGLWTRPGPEWTRSAVDAACDGVLGILSGMLLGWIAFLQRTDGPERRRDRGGEWACWAIVGCYLGWQAMVYVGEIAAVLAFASWLWKRFEQPNTRTDLPQSMLVAFAAAILLFVWRDAGTLLRLPAQTGIVGIAMSIAITVAGFAVTRLTGQRAKESDD